MDVPSRVLSTLPKSHKHERHQKVMPQHEQSIPEPCLAPWHMSLVSLHVCPCRALVKRQGMGIMALPPVPELPLGKN